MTTIQPQIAGISRDEGSAIFSAVHWYQADSNLLIRAETAEHNTP